jgi:hypothetical protein
MDDYRAQLEAAGFPTNQIDAMVAIATYQKAGGPTSIVSDKVGRILGRPPRTIRDFLHDHADRFIEPGQRVNSGAELIGKA